METNELTQLETYESDIEAIRFRQEAYLRKSGWDHSSSNPLCIWLWEKNCHGKDMTLSFHLALDMQKRLEER